MLSRSVSEQLSISEENHSTAKIGINNIPLCFYFNFARFLILCSAIFFHKKATFTR